MAVRKLPLRPDALEGRLAGPSLKGSGISWAEKFFTGGGSWIWGMGFRNRSFPPAVPVTSNCADLATKEDLRPKSTFSEGIFL